MFEKIRMIVIEQLYCEEDGITEETSIFELGADETDLMEIVMCCEDEFNITITDEAEDIVTVGDLVRTVTKCLEG